MISMLPYYIVMAWFLLTLCGYIAIPLVIIKGRNVEKAVQRRYAKAIATYLIISVVGAIELVAYSQFLFKDVSKSLILALMVMSLGLVPLTWLLMIKVWGEG
ncbi:MAG: hypothetical protein DRZ82_02950 [Thermoprotei archaeon]|nr:MAG: hypothetical protein DRZ82_02950 [Thermoprotei archaeon]